MSNLILRIDGGEHSGRQIWLQPGQVVRVGSSYRCDCQLPNVPDLSPEHFEVGMQPTGAFLRSLDRASPLLLNGQVIQQGTVQSGDQIVVGPLRFSVQLDATAGASPSPPGSGAAAAASVSQSLPVVDWQDMGNGLACQEFTGLTDPQAAILQSLATHELFLVTASHNLSPELTQSLTAHGGRWVDQVVAQPYQQLHDFAAWQQGFAGGRVLGLLQPLGADSFANIAPLSALLATPDVLPPYFDVADPVVGRTLLNSFGGFLLPAAGGGSFRLITELDRTKSLMISDQPILTPRSSAADGIQSSDPSDNDLTSEQAFDPYSETTTDTVMFEGQFSPDDIIEW